MRETPCRRALLVACALALPLAAAVRPEEPAPDRREEGSGQPEGEAPDAEETADPVRLFEQLRVVGSAEEASKLPGSARLITLEQLERQQYDDIHRVLKQIPGVNVQEEEGYGLRPNIGIRGTGVDRSQKITLLEDGVLIAPAPYAAPSAYYSPTAGRMQGFEVRKGSSSIRQGPYTTGGALNYLSTAIPGGLGGHLQLAGGDDGERRARLWVGDARARYGWLLEGYRLEADGFKRLDGGGGTGLELDDYLAKLRFNSRAGAALQQAVEIKLGKTEQVGDETYLGLTQEDFERHPYRRYAASAGDNITTDHRQLQLGYSVSRSERFGLTATLYRNDFFRNWYKLETVAGRSVARVLERPEEYGDLLAVLRGEADSDPGALAVRNNRRDYTSEGLQALLSWRLGRGATRHALDLGIRYHRDREDRFQEDDRFQMLGGRRVLGAAGAPGSQANRIAEAEALALFVQDSLTAGRWTLTPGVRVELIELERRDFGTADPTRSGSELGLLRNDLEELIPGLGVHYALGPADGIFLGIHRGFSPPGPGSSAEVEAERSLNWELGWRRAQGSLSAELIAFLTDYDNLLGNDTVSTGGGGTGDAFNGGAVEVRGLEAALGIDLGGSGPGLALPLRLAYVYTEGRFRSTFETDFADWAPRVERGDELPYLPEHQLYAALSVESGRWSAHVDTSYAAEARTRAGRGPVPRRESLDAHWLVDLRAEVRLGARLRLWGQLLNATDEVYVAARRPAGLRPGRPRAALFGLTFDFPGR